LNFHDVGLDANLLRALDACGFTAPTDIQTKAIPPALIGRDVLASAQTGTGKTAAFALPALQCLLTTPPTTNGRGPRVLVLTPTRELATQVASVFADLARFTKIKCGTIVGGVGFGPQIQLLRNPLDVLVATPGRLIDHMDRGNVDFARLQILVLDEADRMLDMGFLHAVTRIANATPKNRQTMLFSATFEGSILNVANRHLRNPERVQLAVATQRHEGIDQWMHKASNDAHKRAMLDHLLTDPQLSQVVVFTGTKWRAKKLAASLSSQGHASAPLQGNMSQAARQRAVDQLRSGQVRVLVATDVASRGLDVPGISHVINFDLPKTPEDYIHRIGRTGRAGASGIAISLVTPEDRQQLVQIERLTGRPVEPRTIPGMAPVAATLEAVQPQRTRPQGKHNHNRRSTSGGHGRHTDRSGGRAVSG